MDMTGCSFRLVNGSTVRVVPLYGYESRVEVKRRNSIQWKTVVEGDEVTCAAAVRKLRKSARSTVWRKAREEALNSLGLIKCRVNGKTFWE